MSHPHNVATFKADIAAHLDAQPAEPGKYGAVNWAALLNKADGLIQKAAPVIETLTPLQYAAMVELFAGIVHSFAGGGLPVTPPAPSA
jgi:hypothetical protein